MNVAIVSSFSPYEPYASKNLPFPHILKGTSVASLRAETANQLHPFQEVNFLAMKIGNKRALTHFAE